MEYLKIDGEFPRLSGSAVTLGKFDGIHRGHRKLVERILEQKEKGLQTVLFSLGIGSQMIFTKEERCRILSQVEEAVANGTIGEKIVSIEDVLSMYPALICTPEGDRLLGNGNPVPEELVQGGSREEKVRMYKSSGNFTGIYGWDERKQKYVPVRMFFV